ncbi:MAG: MBL fold metallo-hydrolase [Planctomycetota bacterium]|nr:MBL fold metallo-hydrolase [Planctomycetota bacterium]
MKAVLEFLGSGTSTGVPVPGCRCRVCRSPDPRDRRLRSSVLISLGKRRLVVDTGPEFRIQCLRAGVERVDAVLVTHHHADHLYGLDDIRAYSFFKRRTIPVWAAPATLREIRRHFAYIWRSSQIGGGLPDIELRPVEGGFKAIGIDIVPIPIKHGELDILGYRLGNLAYMTDISRLPPASLPLLENLDAMVVSCVRCHSHPTHLSLIEVKRLHRLLRPRRTLLTHLAHRFSHRELLMELARFDIFPAYDGLRINLDGV